MQKYHFETEGDDDLGKSFSLVFKKSSVFRLHSFENDPPAHSFAKALEIRACSMHTSLEGSGITLQLKHDRIIISLTGRSAIAQQIKTILQESVASAAQSIIVA